MIDFPRMQEYVIQCITVRVCPLREHRVGMSTCAALATCEMGTAVTVKLMARCILLDTKNCAKCTTTPGIIDTGTFQFVCHHRKLSRASSTGQHLQ